MFSVFYSHDRLECEVSQPHMFEYSNRPQPLLVQISLCTSINLQVIRHDCFANIFTEPVSYSDRRQFHRFPLHILRDHERTKQRLRPILSTLRISPNSPLEDKVIDDFAREVDRVLCENRASNRGLHVVPFLAEFKGILVEHVRDERTMTSRALLESASESNYSMVPAKMSSVKKMLKRVRIEVEEKEDNDDDDGETKVKKQKVIKGEDCVICLEEMEIGSIASRMPCSHTFHCVCIEKWLRQSHYCPVCRFDVPT